MKNLFVWGNPPPHFSFLTLSFAVIAMLVSGCSDTSISEIDPLEDQTATFDTK